MSTPKITRHLPLIGQAKCLFKNLMRIQEALVRPLTTSSKSSGVLIDIWLASEMIRPFCSSAYTGPFKPPRAGRMFNLRLQRRIRKREDRNRSPHYTTPYRPYQISHLRQEDPDTVCSPQSQHNSKRLHSILGLIAKPKLISC